MGQGERWAKREGGAGKRWTE